MCEGKGYDEKSDIWALGCIVYEMACLQKTFEGSNLPGIIFLDKFLTFFWKKVTHVSTLSQFTCFHFKTQIL